MEIKTVVIQIGNSDNKLTQKEWAEYYKAIERIVDMFSETIFFKGCSMSNAEYQNAAFIFSIEDGDYGLIKALTNVRKRFNQDSLAYQIGETDLI